MQTDLSVAPAAALPTLPQLVLQAREAAVAADAVTRAGVSLVPAFLRRRSPSPAAHSRV